MMSAMVGVMYICIHAMYVQRKLHVAQLISYIHSVLLVLVLAVHAMQSCTYTIPIALLPFIAWHLYLMGGGGAPPIPPLADSRK